MGFTWKMQRLINMEVVETYVSWKIYHISFTWNHYFRKKSIVNYISKPFEKDIWFRKHLTCKEKFQHTTWTKHLTWKTNHFLQKNPSF